MTCENVIPIKDSGGGGEVGDFASRDAGEANPSGLTHALAIRYKDSGQSEPKPVIFRGIYRLQLRSARFSGDLNAETSVRSRIRSLGSFGAPARPSIKQTGEKSQAEGPQLEVGGVRLAKPGQGASATTEEPAGTGSATFDAPGCTEAKACPDTTGEGERNLLALQSIGLALGRRVNQGLFCS